MLVGVVARYSIGGCNQYPRCGASAPHFAEHHIALLFRPLLPPSSVRLHKTSTTSLYAPIQTRAYSFCRVRWRRARSQFTHSTSWSGWSFSPVIRYESKPACKISLLRVTWSQVQPTGGSAKPVTCYVGSVHNGPKVLRRGHSEHRWVSTRH